MVSTNKGASSSAKFPETHRVSILLILFRWVALVIASLFIFLEPNGLELNPFATYILLSFTFFYTVSVSYFYGKDLQNLNQFTRTLVIVDALYCGFLLWVTGSPTSPFFLYAISPILTAAFFLKMKGGFAAAGVVSILYIGGMVANGYSLAGVIESKQAVDLITDILALFLVAVFFAYPSALLDRLLFTVNNLITKNDNLTDTNRAFEHANRQLRTLQKTSKALQSTMDLNEILDIVLSEITREIGFEGAMLGLYNEKSKTISNWIMSKDYGKGFMGSIKDLEIPISEEGGIVAKSVIENKPYLVNPEDSSAHIQPSHLKEVPFAVVPMTFKGRTVGVLLVENHLSKRPISETEIPVLRSVANQATVAIENARLMIRNQMLVVAEERNRIAREIHDGLAQSLFSIALNLQACVKKMGNNPAETRDKLVQLQELASKNLKELRQYIYNLPSATLVDMGLVTALKSHINDIAKLNGLEIDFTVGGKERTLPSEMEECFYRVGQEALANVVKHAKASRVKMTLEYGNKDVTITVVDNGRGLNGEAVAKESMGINNMRQRIKSLGGTFSLESSNGCGVCVKAKVRV